MTSPAVATDWDAFVKELITCPAEHLESWIATHRQWLQPDLLLTLKDYAVAHAVTAPKAVDQITRYALVIAEQMPEEPLAFPVACWARGFWGIFYAPHDAVGYFEQALVVYRRTGDALKVASLLTNLVYVLAVCGRFAEAEAAYQEALPVFVACQADEPYRLIRLKQNYGILLNYQGHYEEAIATYEQVFALAQQHGYMVVATEMQVNRALELVMVGRLAECESVLLQARQTAETDQQTLTVARIDMNLGELYTALGQPAAALRRFQSARGLFAEQTNKMEVGSVLMREAALFLRIGAWRAARRCYAQAQAIFLEHQMLPEVGQALVQLVGVYCASCEFNRAAKLLAEAEALWSQLQQPLWLTVVALERIALCLAQQDVGAALTLLQSPSYAADNLLLTARHELLLAEAYRQRADHPNEAQRAYERVLAYAQAQGDRWLERQALAGLGQLLLDKAPETGSALLARAVEYDDHTRQTLSVEELKASFQAQTSDLLPILARFAVTQQQPWQALSYSWQAKTSAFADLLTTIALEQMLSPTEATELRQTRQQLAVRRWTLAQQTSPPLPHNFSETSDPVLQALEDRLYELRRKRNLSQVPTNGGWFKAPQHSLAHMEADILLEYIACGDQVLGIYAARAGHCRAIWLCAVSELLDLLDELQLTFQNVVTQPLEHHLQHGERWRAECLPLLRRCYDCLIRPLLADSDSLIPGRRLLIAPCAPLYWLPFAAFWDGYRYLATRCQLEMILSGGFLTLPPAPAAQQVTPPLVIAASAAGTLAGAQAEAAAVTSALPESVAFIDQPQAIDYLSRISAPPRLLHIAAHSLLRHDAPIFSALQLTGEVLAVEQCYELPLAGTTLVTLSGCTTATGLDTGGALLAFQSALFGAGAQRVLSTLWPVSDSATAHWMAHFYRWLTQSGSAVEALHQTQCTLLNDPAYSHPALWAAFVCTRR